MLLKKLICKTLVQQLSNKAHVTSLSIDLFSTRTSIPFINRMRIFANDLSDVLLLKSVQRRD